jgi:agmatinase
MKLIFALAVFVVQAFGHDHHDHDDQVPVGYVKYPYQAVMPHDDG